MFNLPVRISAGIGSAALLALLLAGCDSNTYVEPPPPRVTVAKPLVQEVTDHLDFTGTVVATEHAEVRARVSGILQSMLFEPGTLVEEGSLLFIIEPTEYEADLQAANAELAAAKSGYDRARIEYERAKKLFKEKAGAEAEVVTWRVEREIASAEILRAEAKVARAELNLSYTQVTAPFSGRVGRDEVDIGNLVGESEATVLTDITRYDPMYVYFNLNERDLLRIAASDEKRGKQPDADSAQQSLADKRHAVFIGLANEEGHPHEGILDFAESGLDTETGTIRLRAVFDNPGSPPVLLPGLFARVRMPLGTRPDIPLVSERAIAQDQSGRYLMIVDAENKVEKVNVRTGQNIDGLVVIEAGLRKDDRVIVKGLQRARPGRVVNPETVEMASLTTTAMREAADAAKKADAVSKTAPAQPGDAESTPPADGATE